MATFVQAAANAHLAHKTKEVMQMTVFFWYDVM